MATTVQNIIDRATEKSNLNDASLVDTTELIAYISTYEQQIYLTAARLNPDFFGYEGTTSVRASSTDSWNAATTPGNVAAVSDIEIAAITGTVSGLSVGDKVSLVSIRDPDVALSPRVYMRNRVIREYNSELQTDASNYVTRLKLYYSYLPARRTATSDTLDLPDEFDSLIYLPLARDLAIRDQRPEEAGPIDSLFSLHWATFLSQVGVQAEGEIREYDRVQAAAPSVRLAGAEGG